MFVYALLGRFRAGGGGGREQGGGALPHLQRFGLPSGALISSPPTNAIFSVLPSALSSARGLPDALHSPTLFF